MPIPPKWPDDTVPRLPFPSGVCVAAEAAKAGEARDGSSVPVAGGGSRAVDMVVTGERR
jgi:hypothetical protein